MEQCVLKSIAFIQTFVGLFENAQFFKNDSVGLVGFNLYFRISGSLAQFHRFGAMEVRILIILNVEINKGDVIPDFGLLKDIAIGFGHFQSTE